MVVACDSKPTAWSDHSKTAPACCSVVLQVGSTPSPPHGNDGGFSSAGHHAGGLPALQSFHPDPRLYVLRHNRLEGGVRGARRKRGKEENAIFHSRRLSPGAKRQYGP